MRKALVVGIDHYAQINGLYGCVNDAHSVKSVLERHGTGSVNFGVELLVATDKDSTIGRRALKTKVEELFRDDAEIALFYFAGHGYIESVGGFLCTSDSKDGDDGLSLAEVLVMANGSKANNKIIILDSCHSGVTGKPPGMEQSVLAEGTTILTASAEDQYAAEANGSGLFTSLLVDALEGSAANLVGQITPGSVYAHIDQSLGPWSQRPIFKTNVRRFISLREVPPPISLEDLRRITAIFQTAGFEHPLDPSYEEEENGKPEGALPANPDNVRTFKVLQAYNRVNLVVPVGAPHMWHAAIESKWCRLTVLGEHYRSLVEQGLI